MMQSNTQYIQQLMLEKLSGIISPEEELYLDAQIANDASVQKAWTQLKGRYRETDIQEHFSRFEAPDLWNKVHTAVSEIRPSGRMPLYIKWLAAAAVLTGIIFTLYSINSTEQPSLSSGKPLVTPKKEAVQLQLANGEVLDLSADQSNVNLSGAQITASNKTLSYTITAGSTGGMNKLTVPVGMDYKVQLADGSEVWMNSATRLEFPFSFNGKTREITLNGEAYLQVAKDPTKQFIVHTPNSTIKVLGTAFNINTYDENTTRLALVEGLVQIGAEGKTQQVKAGQEAILFKQKEIRLQAFDADDVLSWRKGIYYFYNTSLADVCAVLPRWYGIQVKMDDPSLGNKPIAGMIDKHKPVEDFLQKLKISSTVNYYFDEEGILHFK